MNGLLVGQALESGDPTLGEMVEISKEEVTHRDMVSMGRESSRETAEGTMAGTMAWWHRMETMEAHRWCHILTTARFPMGCTWGLVQCLGCQHPIFDPRLVSDSPRQAPHASLAGFFPKKIF